MMATCKITKLDCVGRVFLPKEVRGISNIKPLTEVEVFIVDDMIYINKYIPRCLFCRDNKGTITFKNKLLCEKCYEEITTL